MLTHIKSVISKSINLQLVANTTDDFSLANSAKVYKNRNDNEIHNKIIPMAKKVI